MVLLALSVFVVSLSYFAYRFGTYWRSQPLKSPDSKHATTGKSPPPDGQEKPRPTLTSTAPEIFRINDNGDFIKTSTMMKDPFEETEDQKPSENSMPPPTLKLMPPGTPKATNVPNGMMAPPPLLPSPKAPILQTLPKPSAISSLRPPPSAASTLRAPPTRSPASSSLLAPSTSTLAPSARPSRKILLEPGHSPLDWAHLTNNPPTPTFLRGAVPPQLIRVPPSLLKYHNGRKDKETGKKKDAWGVWQGKVYNLTPYLKFHPGGDDQLMRGAGNTKAEALFNETHQWISWESMMGECLVGILVSENEAIKENTMEGMD